jgi:hypothetical protein
MARSKKGRLTGGKRQEVNSNRVAKILSGEVKDIAFARVRKHLGSGRVLVAIDSKHGPREIQAQIPNVFGRKGSTPINSTTVVTIVVGEDFDVEKDITPTSHFKIESILSDDQSRSLVRKGMIPDWMLIIDAADAAAAAAAAEETFYFEAEDEESEESEESTEGISHSSSSSSSSNSSSSSSSSSSSAAGGGSKKKAIVRKEDATAFNRKAALESARKDEFDVDDI